MNTVDFLEVKDDMSEIDLQDIIDCEKELSKLFKIDPKDLFKNFDKDKEMGMGNALLTVSEASSKISLISQQVVDSFSTQQRLPELRSSIYVYIGCLSELLAKNVVIYELQKEVKSLKRDNEDLKDLLEIACDKKTLQ